MRKKICFVVAVPGTAESFLRDHIAALANEYDVFLVGNIKCENEVKMLSLTGWQRIEIERGISLWRDLKAVFSLYKYFKKMNFNSVHSVTPKAGLLTSISAYFACIPVRIHIYTGQVWANKTGFMRHLLKMMDRIIALLDNHIIVDGKGQRQFLIQNKVVRDKNSKVLGSGSICGVNLERFKPSGDVRMAKRIELSIEDSKTVFVFMGRLNHDKGVYDLLSAFNRLASEREDVYLLLLGHDEENVSATFHKYSNIKEGENFCYYGATPEPYKMLQAGDVFVLPTYREGFGSSVIEASSLGLPVICSDAYGVMDAMIDDVTGIRCKVGNEDS